MTIELTKEQIIEVREIVDNSVRVASMCTHYLVAERAYERAYARGLEASADLIAAMEGIIAEIDENECGASLSVRIGKARAVIKKARGE